MAKKRYITNPFIDQLGGVKASSKVLLINTDGELVNSGKTISEVSAGVALESDNVNDSSPNINKFVSQTEIDKLNNIAVNSPVDLNLMQSQLQGIADADLAQYLIDNLDF